MTKDSASQILSLKNPHHLLKRKKKKAIVFNTFQEDTRPYFSSPCMLSEMEDDEDFLNR